MANKTKDENDVKNIRIPILVSKNDLKRHGGRSKLSTKFRAVRDGK